MSQPFVQLPDKVAIGTRFGARVVDGLILFIPMLVLTAPIAGGFKIGTGNSDSKQMVATALGVALAYLYFVVCEATRGATFGKSACHIDVASLDGGRPTLLQAARRNAWMLLSVVPATVGGFLTLAACVAVAITISKDPTGRGFHDRWAGTITRDRD